MEKEQIIKALECCIGDNADCNSCPYWVDVDVNCFDNVKSDALALIKELTEENERLKAEVSVKQFLLDKCVDLEDRVKADTVREIFKEIYSSLDYIEEQMEPEEIPECFFSVREDINALKEKFESEGAADEI